MLDDVKTKKYSAFNQFGFKKNNRSYYWIKVQGIR